MMTIGLSKNEKVKDASGIDINARLIPTGTAPVLHKGTEIFSLTVTLGKLSHQGGRRRQARARSRSRADRRLLQYQRYGHAVVDVHRLQGEQDARVARWCELNHKPVVSKLSANGGVASLREQSIALNDDTLEFYGVVPNAIKVAMADGNLKCGTDEKVGNAAFLTAGGGTVEGCATMLKNRELAVFAVRVKTKTIASSSSAAAE